MKQKPKNWKSLKTENEFPYCDYCNHGWGGMKHGKIDLPKDEYPYTIIYEKQELMPLQTIFDSSTE